MHSPEGILDIHTTLCRTLPKMAVLVIYDNGDRFLVSQSKDTITPFNEILACHFYSCNLDHREIECYELRYDKIISIDVRKVSQLSFIGGGEVPPPIYINPKFAGILPDEKLREMQFENFLKDVLEQRNRGCYIEQPYSEQRVSDLSNIRYYIEHVFGLTCDAHPLFNVLRSEVTSDFFLYSNIKDGDRLLELRDRIYFMPAILACYNQTTSNLTDDTAAEYIERLYDISDLKSKWVEKLEELKKIHISNLQKDRENVNNYIVEELKSKMNFETVTQTVQHVLGIADTKKQPDLDMFTRLQEELIGGIIDQIRTDTSSAAALSEITPNIVKFYLDFYQEDISTRKSNVDQKDYELINEILLKLGASVFNSALAIREQYDTLLNQTKDIDFKEELEGINDFRVYLRYWPEFFEMSPLVLTDIRSFNANEMQAIKILLAEGIEIEDVKLSPEYNDWSVFRLMEDKIDIMRNKRLDQIKSAAKQRVAELKKEMEPLFNTLSEEEQTMFNNMLKDVDNESRYVDELSKEQTLEGVLSYWPLVLYPKPNNVLSV